MNKKQSNKLYTFQGVQGVLETNRGLYESIEIINRSVDEFIAIVEELNAIAGRAGQDTTGETSVKVEEKKKLSTLTSALAASGMALAYERLDLELQAAMDYSFSEIMYARDAETLAITRAIEEELLSHREDLASYMVSEEDLLNLHKQIESYEKSMVIREEVKASNVAETKRLVILFKVADDLLNQKLDQFITRLRTQHPKFYDAYKSARVIVDL